MALPTVHYDASGPVFTNSTLVVEWMPRLQTLLFAAGWTINYADADAIGTGSAATPAWDKTPVAGAVAGIAIYTMPANGHATAWAVKISPFWSSTSSSYIGFEVTVGTAWDGGTGLTNPTGVYRAGGFSTSTTEEWHANASEDGFTVWLAGNSTSDAWTVNLERLRAFDGTVGDRLALLMWSAGFPTKNGANHGGYTLSAVIDPTTGEFAATDPVFLARFATTTPTGPPSLLSVDGTGASVIGPFPVGDGLHGPPRLFVLTDPVTYVADSEVPIYVDGAYKTYQTADVTYDEFGYGNNTNFVRPNMAKT